MLKPKVVLLFVLVMVALSAFIKPAYAGGPCNGKAYNYRVMRQDANGSFTHISYNCRFDIAVANLSRHPSHRDFATHVFDDAGNLVAGGGIAPVYPATGQAVVVTQQMMDEASRVADLERQVAELNQRVDQMEGRMDAVETLGVYQQGQIDSLTAIFQPDGAGGSNSLVQSRRWNDSGLNVVIQLALVLFGMIVVVATGYGIRHWWNNRNRPQPQQPRHQAGGFDMGRGPNNPGVPPPPDDDFDDVRFGDAGQNGQQREPAQPVVIINQDN